MYDPNRYGAAQDLGRSLRASGSPGIVNDSVRRPQGQCAAVFKPRSLGNARAAGHIALHWDGCAMCRSIDSEELRQPGDDSRTEPILVPHLMHNGIKIDRG